VPGVTVVKQMTKWCIAGLVTITAFAVVTWICGSLALSPLSLDSGARWGIAASAGVAVAALAALWGHGFATRVQEGAEHEAYAKAPATASGTPNVHNEIRGDVQGSVLQGRDIYGPVIFGAADPPRHPDLDTQKEPPR
jgi:hypothetical protein